MKCKNCERYVQKEEYFNDEYEFFGFCWVCLNQILHMPLDVREKYLKKFEKKELI